MNSIKLKHVTWIPVVIVMILIFNFSSHTGERSGKTSQDITKFFLNLYSDIFQRKITPELVQTFNLIIRKSAHFLEYALLSFLAGIHLRVLGYSIPKVILYSVLFSACYAATDEFHQSFVSGRTASVFDVLIDSSGALTGSLFLSGVLMIVHMTHKGSGSAEERF